jgi:hypothetical protein
MLIRCEKIRISPSGFQQAFFDSDKGGLGLKLAARVAPAAFIASSIATPENIQRLLPDYCGSQEALTQEAISVLNLQINAGLSIESLSDDSSQEGSLQGSLRRGSSRTLTFTSF